MNTVSHRVLLVEDNDLNRKLVRTILSRSKDPAMQAVTLVDAPDLATARTELAATAVDLVLLDMQLPDGDGISLAEELRDAQGPARPTVVALTASVLPEQQKNLLAAGCHDFLGKPYNPQQLIDVIAEHITPVDGD